MKQPMFVYEGKSYKVNSVSFHADGHLSHLSFEGERGHTTAFPKNSWDKEGYGEEGIFHTDLYKCLQLHDA